MIANQSAADEYREIAGRFTGLVEGVPDDGWDDALERAIHLLAERVSFDVSDHDVTLHGECEACRSA